MSLPVFFALAVSQRLKVSRLRCIANVTCYVFRDTLNSIAANLAMWILVFPVRHHLWTTVEGDESPIKFEELRLKYQHKRPLNGLTDS
jgi:hypothetical protein